MDKIDKFKATQQEAELKQVKEENEKYAQKNQAQEEFIEELTTEIKSLQEKIEIIQDRVNQKEEDLVSLLCCFIKILRYF